VSDWFSELGPQEEEDVQQEPGGEAPLTRRSRHNTEVRRKASHRRRHVLTAVLAAIVLVVVGFVGVRVIVPFVQDFGHGHHDVEDYAGSGQGTATVVVKDGDGGAAIAQTLVKAGVVATEKSFIEAYNENSKATSIQPGTYKLHKGQSAANAVLALLDEANREVIKVTVPEGYRAAQIYQASAKALGLTVADFQAAAKNPAAIGLPAAAQGQVEGWLFPATYSFSPGTTATQALTQMVKKTTQQLQADGVPAGREHDIVILASMIEKESKLAGDRAKVSQVFQTRLKKGMKLQSDATVSYGAQDFTSVYTTDKERAADNPWNTYVHTGLPATAICSPGDASIQAALDPAPTHYLYFVAVNLDTGETVFSKTEAQHQAAIQKLQAWEATAKPAAG
jgi:UPF0755 protein